MNSDRDGGLVVDRNEPITVPLRRINPLHLDPGTVLGHHEWNLLISKPSDVVLPVIRILTDVGIAHLQELGLRKKEGAS